MLVVSVLHFFIVRIMYVLCLWFARNNTLFLYHNITTKNDVL